MRYALVVSMIAWASCKTTGAVGTPPAAGPAECRNNALLASEALTKGRKVFAGVTLKESTPQGKLLDTPKDYDGKTVRIEGQVVGVCKPQGCWAALRGSDGRNVNLKVVDGVADFRVLAKIGQYAVGEGVYQHEGHHGAQVKISGAMIGNLVCP